MLFALALLLAAIASGLSDRISAAASGGPAVYGIDANSGTSAGGTQVRIFGDNFFGITAVKFGTVPAPIFFRGPAGQTIFSESPAQAAGTSVHITVTTANGTSATTAADFFTYSTALPPAVNGISPHRGSASGGAALEIHGSGLSSPNGQTSVRFGTSAPLMCALPFGPMAARAAGLDSSSTPRASGTAQLQAPARLASQDAANGQSRARAISRGGAFSSAPGSATRPMQPAVAAAGGAGGPPCSLGSDSALFVTAPPGSIGTVPVTVTTSLGTSTPGPQSQYAYAAPGP